MVFKFKPGSRLSGDAQVVGEELERIRRVAGMLTPSAVVDESRPEDAPLHEVFTWDDEAAAELYREDQARHLIRSVEVIENNPNAPGETMRVMAYVHVRPAESDPQYMASRDVMAREDLKEQAIADALSGLEGWRRRHAHLDGLREVFAAIDAATRRVVAERAPVRVAKGRRVAAALRA